MDDREQDGGGDDGGTERIIEAANAYVQGHMSSNDASHDYDHIVRVQAIAKLILGDEKRKERRKVSSSRHYGAGRGEEGPEPVEPSPGLCETTVVLGALLHDVNDRKYCSEMRGRVDLLGLLEGWGADCGLARRVDRLCRGVAYSTEMRDAKLVETIVREIPELGLVQDADRLDAIGAVGIGRCFVFGGMRSRAMADSITHFREKLLHLEGLMKTETGRKMARIRTERIRQFMQWWDDELETVSGGVGVCAT